MNRPEKYFKRGRGSYRRFAYERPQYLKCEVCRIACTSFAQLTQHQKGKKHKFWAWKRHQKKKQLLNPSVEEDTFSLEHMVVLDETDDDLPIASAASPASCDSSDPEIATTSDNFPSSHMVILDETNDDNDHLASPASCDSSASESAPSTSATVKTSDGKKKIKTEKLEDDWTAQVSQRSEAEAEAVPGTSRTFSSKKRYAERSKKTKNESVKDFHVEPIENNQDVFKFLKTFAIANSTDLAFAKNIKEMFSDALKKYKQKKMEEIYCTEAEHGPTEEPTEMSNDSCDHEQTKYSIHQAIKKSECERINSGPGSAPNSSPTPSISICTPSADGQPGLHIRKQSDNPDASSVASKSLTYICEDTSNKPSLTNSTNIVQSTATEEEQLMESEDCSAAEAACSGDEDE
ncbi:uncharacterized protein LOC143782321 [Ranitomeya variabilis]|uniref:uncharacterized protein LOC143782321 n=1 Tax=Ranitomeya variabilis TaxID=490064 RepID=UPI0040561212